MTARKALFATGTAFALAFLLAPGAGAAEMKKEEKPPLVIQGQGFSFSVSQPDGWQANEQAMKKYQANLAFSPRSEDGREPEVAIVVRASRKINENVALSLETDKRAYREKYPDVELAPLKVEHPLYATFSQLFAKPGEFHVYTTYLNPKGFDTYFSVVMPKKKSPATPEELAAYEEVLKSLRIALAVEEASAE